MPILTKLSLQNLKGPKGDYHFGPATMIVGPNASGKTRIINGLQLAILGYVPGLGKTNQAIGDLMSGNPMGVFASLGTTDKEAAGIERTYTRSGDKITAKAVQHGGSGVDLVNPGASAIAVLDAEKFMGAGETERIKMIWDLVNITSKDQNPDKILESVPKREELAKNVPRGTILTDANKSVSVRQTAGKKQSSMPGVQGDLHEKMEGGTSGVSTQEPASFQEWLTKALLFARDALKLAKQVVARLDSTQQGLVSLASDQVTETPEEIEGKIKFYEDEREKFRNDLAGLKAKAHDPAPILDRIKRLGGQLEAKRNALEELGDPSHIQNELKEDREWLESIDDVSITEEVAKKHWDEAQTLVQPQKDIVNRLDFECRKIVGELDGYREQTEITTCAHCGAKMSKAKIDAAKERLAEKEAELTAKQGELAGAKKRLESYEVTTSNLKANYEKVAQCSKLRKQIADATAALLQIENLTQDINTLENEKAQAEAELPQADEVLEQTISHVECSITDIEGHLAAEKENLRIANQVQGNKALRAQAELKASQDRLAVEDWKKTVDILETTQQNMIDCAFVELIQYAQPVLDGIMKTPLAYEDGSLGRWDKIDGNDRFIKVSTFSGMETLLVTIGLQAALGSQAPNRIAVFDELGRLGVTNKIQLLKNLAKMIKAGQIEQFIGADVDPAPYKKIKDLILIETTLES